jgi:putative aldouronate transport system substrate-binding protein
MTKRATAGRLSPLSSLAGRANRRDLLAGAVGLGLGGRVGGRALARQEPPPRVQAADTVDGVFPLSDEPVTLRVLVRANPLVEDYATNAFTRWYEERTNVHVEWDVIAGLEEARTALNLRLSAGDLPDVIFGFQLPPPQQILYGAQGVFRRLNDLIETHGVELKRVFAELPLARQVVTAPDGSIYSLPEIAACFHCAMPFKLWIYRPWLEQLGLPLPTTTAEFEDVLRAFKEGDPNGNGRADEIPLVSATTGAQPLDVFLLNAFLFNPGEPWLSVRNGAVTAAYVQPEWRDGVAYLAGLAAAGLIAPESFTQDGDGLRRSTEHPDLPIVGAVPALAPSAFMTIDQVNGGRWTEYVAVSPLAGPTGVRYGPRNPYQGVIGGSFVVTSACRRPEIAVRWADGFYDLETSMRAVEGVPGEHWRWATAGQIGNNGEPAVWERLYSYGQVQNFTWAQTGVYYRPEWLHSGQVLDPAVADRVQPSILYRETAEKYAPYAQPAEWTLPPVFFDEERARDVADLAVAIADRVKQTFALAVIGELDLVAEWDGYLADLADLGLPRYLAAYQAAYDARRPSS